MTKIRQFAVALSWVLVVSMLPRASVPAPPADPGRGVDHGGFNDLVEADCRVCHQDTSNRHHRLYGTPIPGATDALPWPRSGLYVCGSCHALDTDSGRNRFLIERDCRVCHVAENHPPVAEPNGPYTGRRGQPVPFDGAGSFDPDGSIVAYVWDFGDGGVGMGPTPTHTYEAVGTYAVTLTVEDDAGQLSAATTTAEITEDLPPDNVWTLRVPSSAPPGEIEFQIEIEEFGGVLWFDETFPGGQLAFGTGMASDEFVFWMDSLGALFYGSVDHSARTMMGIVFDFMGQQGHDTIFFGESHRMRLSSGAIHGANRRIETGHVQNTDRRR